MSSIFDLEADPEYDRINVKTLKRKEDAKIEQSKEVYNNILRRIHSKITRSRGYWWYVVPQCLLGVTHYSQIDCLHYVMSRLSAEGMFVRYIHPSMLMISWNV